MTTLGYTFNESEFVEKAEWWSVSSKCKLSEEFIDHFRNNVIWMNISKYHAANFSPKFFKKYKSRISVCKMTGSCKI